MNLATDGRRRNGTQVRWFLASVTWLAGIGSHFGARKNGVNGAAVGQRGNARGGYEATG